MFPVGVPFPENQETPSCTRSNRRVNVPPVGGAVTVAWSWTLAPGARSVGSLVRTPSQRTEVPEAVDQW